MNKLLCIVAYSLKLLALPDTLLEQAYRKLLFLHHQKTHAELKKLALPQNLRDELMDRIWFLKSMQHQYQHHDALLYHLLTAPVWQHTQQRLLEYMIAYMPLVLRSAVFKVRPALIMIFMGKSSQDELFTR